VRPGGAGRAWGVVGTVAALALAVLAAAWLDVARLDVAVLARRDPGRSALMRQREREARAAGRPAPEARTWVPLGRISPHLRNAVLVAEDARFFSHEGLDWNEIRESARRNLRARRVVRGGSTITQQLAKNLWLSGARTPWRKLEELLLALRLERELPKRRILELYLNTIEWGPGVYGAEAAARHWFGVHAADLAAGQAIRLAAVIVNPRRYSPVAPNRRITARIRTIASRLRHRGAITEAEYREALGLAPEATAAGTPADGVPVDSLTTDPAGGTPTGEPADSVPGSPPAAPPVPSDSSGNGAAEDGPGRYGQVLTPAGPGASLLEGKARRHRRAPPGDPGVVAAEEARLARP
jgi:monofunctional biosynthetic peptidoglycan transglycosylase